MAQLNDKLTPLLKGAEASERQAGEEYRKIHAVYEERLKRVESLRERMSVLERRRTELHKQTFAAEHASVWARVQETRSFAKRIGSELTEVLSELGAEEIDLQRAFERAEFAQQELVLSRIEKRKLETLAAQRRQASRVEESAREEEFLDELAINRRRERE